MHIAVLMPIFNDWPSAKEVMGKLETAFAASADSLAIVLVDDGSTVPVPSNLGAGTYVKVSTISVLALKKNLGHQRALAIGLCYVADKIPCDALLVMDGDGEDQPTDAFRLAERMKQSSEPTIVFAERTRRSERAPFRLSYAVYKILHLILTGRGIRVGNFSIVPSCLLVKLTVEPMLWNHYAAAVMRAQLPTCRIPTDRGRRLSGQSRLNFVSLVIHGLSALACYAEVIGVRLIFASAVLFFLSLVALIALVGLRLCTTVAVPGWTSLVLGLILILVFQVLTLVTNFTLQIITGRSLQPFMPARDYAWYVSSLRSIYEGNRE